MSAAQASRRGRRSKLGGRLAKTGARALNFARLTTAQFTQPPDYFGEIAIDAYWMIATELAHSRELTRTDAPMIEMAARAYERWVTLDREIAEATAAIADAKRDGRAAPVDLCGEVSAKGFMTGRAQARAAAAKEYRAAAAELGLSPTARIRSSGALQSSFMGVLDQAAIADRAGEPAGDVYRPLRVVE